MANQGLFSAVRALARLLLAFPPRQPKSWSDDDVSGDTLHTYHDMVRELFKLKHDPNSREPDTPSIIRLRSDARNGTYGLAISVNLS